MRIIGIAGEAGSGKTTFAKLLGDHPKVGVIHVDELVGKAKMKYFRPFLVRDNKNKIVMLGQENPKLDSKTKKFFYQNKIAFKLLMTVRSRLVQDELEQRIRDFKIDGMELVVIDDWALKTHKYLDGKLDRTYYLNRSLAGRRKGVRERDGLTPKEMAINDMPYALRHLSTKTAVLTDEQIYNNSSIDDLYEKAIKVREKFVEKTFDEKYKVNHISKAKQKMATLSKLREVEKVKQ